MDRVTELTWGFDRADAYFDTVVKDHPDMSLIHAFHKYVHIQNAILTGFRDVSCEEVNLDQSEWQVRLKDIRSFIEPEFEFMEQVDETARASISALMALPPNQRTSGWIPQRPISCIVDYTINNPFLHPYEIPYDPAHDVKAHPDRYPFINSTAALRLIWGGGEDSSGVLKPFYVAQLTRMCSERGVMASSYLIEGAALACAAQLERTPLPEREFHRTSWGVDLAAIVEVQSVLGEG